MNLKKTCAALVLCGALTLSGAVLPSAQAAEYTDLSRDHWAYSTMMRASRLGLINGVGANQMDPTGTMSWAQFLAVLTRAFAGSDYNAAVAEGQSWDQAGLTAAQSAGMLEGLTVPDDLTAPITRQDAAVLLYNVLPEEYTGSIFDRPIDPETLSDWDQMDSLHQQAVAELARRMVVNGKSDGSFGYADSIQRCDGATLIIRVLLLVDNDKEGDPVTITLRCINANTGMAIVPIQQVQTTVGQSLYGLLEDVDVGYYNRLYRDGDPNSISSACGVYDAYYIPMTQAEQEEAQFWEKVDRGEASREDYYQQDFWLHFQGENQRKSTLLFGDASKRRFDSYEEAAAAMTTISVPVWKLSGGVKVPSTASLTVHAAIAEDVKEIFTEIYNDPEQFPINATSTFRYVEGTTGEHNCGTAIDLNANENYQVRDGVAMVGSFWKPGENPYSITPDGSVVRIFEAHGWSWGGDAWAGSSDPSTGYHDYMHFSYMGG